MSPNTPRSRAHGHVLSKHTRHTAQATLMMWRGRRFFLDCLCLYICECVCVCEKKKGSFLRIGISETVLSFNYPGRLNDGLFQERLCPVVISMVVDPLSVFTNVQLLSW